MSTSVADAVAVKVWTDRESLWVRLADGRVLGVPLRMFPRLAHGSDSELLNVQIGPGGLGLHWPELDEDISVAGLFAGLGDGTAYARKHRQTCATCG